MMFRASKNSLKRLAKIRTKTKWRSNLINKLKSIKMIWQLKLDLKRLLNRRTKLKKYLVKKMMAATTKAFCPSKISK